MEISSMQEAKQKSVQSYSSPFVVFCGLSPYQRASEKIRPICKISIYDASMSERPENPYSRIGNCFEFESKSLWGGRLDLLRFLGVTNGEISLDIFEEMILTGAPADRRAPSTGHGSLGDGHGGSL
jgi:hypothetical protein